MRICPELQSGKSARFCRGGTSGTDEEGYGYPLSDPSDPYMGLCQAHDGG